MEPAVRPPHDIFLLLLLNKRTWHGASSRIYLVHLLASHEPHIMTSQYQSLTVRVGCSLVYTTSVFTPTLLVLRPRQGENFWVRRESCFFGPYLSPQEVEDVHGNLTCRTMLVPGRNEITMDALVSVPAEPENSGMWDTPVPINEIPMDVLRYTLPSRYCDSDKLKDFAWNLFGQVNHGMERVQAISNWVHKNIEYRTCSGSPEISASDVIARGYGVCRDFAHITVALCRAFNLPARYVTGHLPDIGCLDPGSPMDFHAYAEVYVGRHWYTVDARFNVPRIGRIKMSHGLDAVDGAFSTIYGEARLDYFLVWAYQVNPDQVSLGDPIDLSKRLDSSMMVRYS